jgi:hypothetical protein
MTPCSHLTKQGTRQCLYAEIEHNHIPDCVQRKVLPIRMGDDIESFLVL